MFGFIRNFRLTRSLKRLGAFLLCVVALLALVPFLIPIQPLERVEPAKQLATIDSSFVTVGFEGTNGIDYHFVRTGPGAPRFILLHGFTFNAFTWNSVLPFLAQNGGAVAYDRIPFGLSERLVRGDWQGINPYSPEATLAQLFLLMDRLRIPSAILVGNSAGATLAVRAALAKPDRVDGLILIGAPIYTPERSFSSSLAKLPQVQRLGPLIARQVGANETILRNSFADPDRISSTTRMLRAMNTRVVRWDQALWEFIVASTLQPDLSPLLEDVTQPVLIINGTDDQLSPADDAARLDSELPNSRLAIIPDCGHVPQEECPDALVEAIDDWLAGRME